MNRLNMAATRLLGIVEEEQEHGVAEGVGSMELESSTEEKVRQPSKEDAVDDMAFLRRCLPGLEHLPGSEVVARVASFIHFAQERTGGGLMQQFMEEQ